MRVLSIAALAGFLLLATAHARGAVSLTNGNFNVGFRDIVWPGAMPPNVDRVYNSKSSHDGFFGFGWGCDYEVYMAIGGDGVLVVHENGGGAQNAYSMAGHPTPGEVEAEVNQILAARKPSEGDIPKERRRFLNDMRQRNDEWERLLREKRVTPPDVPRGTLFTSERFGHQTLARTAEGYAREYADGRRQLFDRDGHLVRVTDTSSNVLLLAYDARGWLETVENNLGHKVRFTFNADHKVTEIRASDGRRATYRYRGNELVESRNASGETHTYGWSDNGRHNLVRVGYPDKTSLRIAYHPVSRYETVRVVTDRLGEITVYSYTGEGPSADHYETGVETTDAQGRLLSQSRYEYFERAGVAGARFKWRIIEDVDGDRTDTTYVEKCNLPLRVERNGEVTTFAYDDQCLATRKETSRAPLESR